MPFEVADVAEAVFYEQDGSSPVTVFKPAAFGPGELLIVVAAMDGGVIGDLTAPAGWTVDPDVLDINPPPQEGKVWHHWYSAADPSTWSFGHDPSGSLALVLLRISGAHVAAPAIVVPAPGTTASNGVTMDSPSVTPTDMYDLLISAVVNFGGGSAFSASAPSGMTGLGSIQGTGHGEALAAAKEQLSSSAPTGVRTWTSISPTGQAGGTFSIAVKSLALFDPDPPPNPPPPIVPPNMLRALVLARQQKFNGYPGPSGSLVRTDLLCTISGTTGAFGAGAFVTSAFVPPDNSLLVVGVSLIENGSTGPNPHNDLTIVGGGWTYTSRVAQGADSTFATGTVIYTAPVSTGASMTLTLDCGARAIAEYSVSVVAYTGYDTTTPTGATATGFQVGGFTGPPDPVALTLSVPPPVESEVFGFIGINKSTVNTTPGTNWAEICDVENTDWGGAQSQFRRDSTSTSVSWQSIRQSGSLFNYAAVALEIRSFGAAPTVVQPAPTPLIYTPAGSRSRPVVLVSRSLADTPIVSFDVPPVATVEAQPPARSGPVTIVTHTPAPAESLPVALVVTPPSFRPTVAPLVLRSVDTPTVAATPPASLVVAPSTTRNPTTPVVTRSVADTPILAIDTPPVAGVVVGPTPRPGVVAITSRSTVDPVSADIPPAALVYAPWTSRRAGAVIINTPRVEDSPPRPTVVVARPTLPRPGVTITQHSFAEEPRAPLAYVITQPRRQTFPPPWVQTPRAEPPVYPPTLAPVAVIAVQPQRADIRSAVALLSRSISDHSCDTDRPVTGTILRPTGTTIRPTGTTARPGSGLTIRPEDGSTENQC